MAQRDESIVPLSREHHYGLLLGLKLRRGLAGLERSAEWVARRVSDVQAFFRSDLTDHFRAEEDILFPAITSSAEWARLVSELVADHRLLGRLVEQIVSASDAERRQLLLQFADRMEKHIRREENELFPLYERLADEVLKQAVGEKLRNLVGDGKEPRSRALLFDPWDLSPSDEEKMGEPADGSTDVKAQPNR
jgi:hemerythrin-like domain-containing protein